MQLTTGKDSLAIRAQPSSTWVSALVIGTLLFVFGLDRATGSAPVQHLYYLPIILAGFRFGMPGGVIAGFSAIVLYHAANPHLLTFKYEESDLVQILLFVAVGVMTAKLTRDADRLRRLALTDDLTGLHNLRSFETQLTTMTRVSREKQIPLTLLVLDVDRLKLLNDQYGHLAGAEAVRTVGHVIAQRLPPGGVACRYGGDEFAIALPRCSRFQVRQVADDLCRAVHDTAPVLSGRGFPAGTLSISVGASCAPFNPNPTSGDWSSRDVQVGEALFRSADAALYRAKAGGRNRICVA